MQDIPETNVTEYIKHCKEQIPQFQQLCEAAEASKQQAQKIREENEADFGRLDESAYRTDMEAELLLAEYQETASKLQMHLVDEKEKENILSFSDDLLQNAQKFQLNQSKQYSKLLTQVLSSLENMHSTADIEFSVQQQTRQEAQIRVRQLEIDAHRKQVMAALANLRKERCQELQITSIYDTNIAETAALVYRNRQRTAEQICSIADNRSKLQETLQQYAVCLEETHQLEEQEQNQEEYITNLQHQLKESSSRCTPFLEQIQLLQSRKEQLENQIKSAEDEVQRIEKQKASIEADLQERQQAVAEATEKSKKDMEQLLSANSERQEALQRKIAQQQETIETYSQQEQSLQQKGQELNESIAQTKDKLQRATASIQPLVTITENTRRMIENIAERTNQDDDVAEAIPSKAEVVLQNTLNTSLKLVEEKKLIRQRIADTLEQLQEQQQQLEEELQLLQQTIRQAQQDLSTAQQEIKADLANGASQEKLLTQRSNMRIDSLTQSMMEADRSAQSIRQTLQIIRDRKDKLMDQAQQNQQVLTEIETAYEAEHTNSEQLNTQLENAARKKVEKLDQELRQHSESIQQLWLDASLLQNTLKNQIADVQRTTEADKEYADSYNKLQSKAAEYLQSMQASIREQAEKLDSALKDLTLLLPDERDGAEHITANEDVQRSKYGAENLIRSARAEAADILKQSDLLNYQQQLVEAVQTNNLLTDPIPVLSNEPYNVRINKDFTMPEEVSQLFAPASISQDASLANINRMADLIKGMGYQSGELSQVMQQLKDICLEDMAAEEQLNTQLIAIDYEQTSEAHPILHGDMGNTMEGAANETIPMRIAEILEAAAAVEAEAAAAEAEQARRTEEILAAAKAEQAKQVEEILKAANAVEEEQARQVAEILEAAEAEQAKQMEEILEAARALEKETQTSEAPQPEPVAIAPQVVEAPMEPAPVAATINQEEIAAELAQLEAAAAAIEAQQMQPEAEQADVERDLREAEMLAAEIIQLNNQLSSEPELPVQPAAVPNVNPVQMESQMEALPLQEILTEPVANSTTAANAMQFAAAQMEPQSGLAGSPLLNEMAGVQQYLNATLPQDMIAEDPQKLAAAAQIAEAEALAQRIAEQEAALLEQQRNAAQAAESERLTMLARSMSQQNAQPEAAGVEAAAPAQAQPGANEVDDDFEEELRRLIFSDLQ